MSYVLTREQYNKFPFEFNEVISVTKELGANIGSVWSELLGTDYLHKVSGFVSRGLNVYALVEDTYQDDFNLYSWISSRLTFKPKVSLSPLNYSIVLGTGTLPRNVEEIIEEIESVRGSTSAPIVEDTPIDYSLYDDSDGATTLIAEDCFILDFNGSKFEVYDEGDVYTVGRGSSSDFKVKAKGVSRTHLNVRYRSGYLEIMDLNSTNGTKVDGVKIPTNTWVKVSEDSVIKLGKAKLFTSKLEEE